MYRLEATYRCDLFEQLAVLVWNHVAEHHEQGVHAIEEGITNQIITAIRNNHKIKNIAIWANNGLRESEFGSDIDIFIEAGTNRFHWYALQAKVLTKKGNYLGITAKKQWEKLAELQTLSECIPLFLFYNGFRNKVSHNIVSCSHTVAETQFGCSIIPNEQMPRLMEQYPNPQYKDFHPYPARPWRELVCCTNHRKSGKIYTLAQVKNAVDLYDKLVNTDTVDIGLQPGNQGNANDSAISEANEAVGRQPKLSMVIRTTNGLNQVK